MSNLASTTGFSQEKIDAIKRLIAKDANDLELEMFLLQCARFDLDPLAKQIHFTKRRQKEGNEWVEKMVTIVSIDGLRLIAARTGKYMGSPEPSIEFGDDGWPISAAVTVYKSVEGQTCSWTRRVYFREYCSYNQSGMPVGTWARMPVTMIAKVAEAHALRAAFPMELAGAYEGAEMDATETIPVVAIPKNPNQKNNQLSDITSEPKPLIDHFFDRLKAKLDNETKETFDGATLYESGEKYLIDKGLSSQDHLTRLINMISDRETELYSDAN